MKLEDVKFGIDHIYKCRLNDCLCYVVNCDHEDGASLIIEKVDDEDFDLTNEFTQSEACHLTPVTEVNRKMLNSRTLKHCPHCNYTLRELTPVVAHERMEATCDCPSCGETAKMFLYIEKRNLPGFEHENSKA